MTPERWRQLENIYNAAQERSPGERGAYLAEACQGDQDLLHELESLLAQKGSLLEHPAWAAEPPPTITHHVGLPSDSASSPQPRAAQSQAALPPDAPTFWGPFRLIEKVGQGAFGEVYRAWDPTLEREVALKLLLPRGLDPEAETRTILQEARLIARVRHPNIVPVYGVDQHDGRVGFWSEFVRGKTLSMLLQSQGPFGSREAAHIGIELCKAVSAVHSAGLLHRDIKAGNVMREEGGRILLMDFGLTHETGQATQAAGTPAYMAPELLLGEPASVSSDVYALGVLLFHLVTAKYPVEGTTVRDLQSAHTSGTRRSLISERPDLPEGFVHIIETAVDPKRRFASAGELLSALSESIGRGPASQDSLSVTIAPKKSRLRWWMIPASVAAAALLVFLTPVRNLLPMPEAVRIATSGAREGYLKAQDMLEHYYKPHNIENSVALFQQVVAEDPKFALAYSGLARAYWFQYRDTRNIASIEPAKNACNRALELDRDIAGAHVTLGMIYTDAGRNDLAAEELKEALRLDARSADAYGALADLYQKQGRDAEVEPAIQKAIDLAPGQWRYVNQLGNYHLSTGKYPAAAEQFQQAVKLNPDNSRAFNNLGISYLRQSRYPEAQTAFERAIQLEPDYSRYSNLGIVFERQGKYPEAASMYQRAIDMNPYDYLARANLGSAYEYMQGTKQKARESYLKAIELAEEIRKRSPNDAMVLARLGSYYVDVQMSEKGMPLLRQAVALSPKDPEIVFRMGHANETLHRRQEALRWIGQALDLGYSFETIEHDPDLDALRSDSRFPTRQAKVR
jgi:serine/threonine protein kinase/Tfp pilus assembly protein PilF